MIQNILALVIVGLVLIRTIYVVYKAVTTRDKSLCGGCASCDLKHELKKKGMLISYADKKAKEKTDFAVGSLKYAARKSD